MAEIVLGIGTSHGPLLSTPPEKWDLRAQADRLNKQHYFRGKSYDYESLLKERAPGFANRAGHVGTDPIICNGWRGCLLTV